MILVIINYHNQLNMVLPPGTISGLLYQHFYLLVNTVVYYKKKKLETIDQLID